MEPWYFVLIYVVVSVLLVGFCLNTIRFCYLPITRLLRKQQNSRTQRSHHIVVVAHHVELQVGGLAVNQTEQQIGQHSVYPPGRRSQHRFEHSNNNSSVPPIQPSIAIITIDPPPPKYEDAIKMSPPPRM